MTDKSIPGQPLAGVKVLDVSRVLAGPLAAQCLGDMGADVIKLEHPKRGDDTRDWGLTIGGRDTTYFYSMNRNKRSIGLDLQNERDRALAIKLASQSDVLIQNFKAGGAEKLGLGYEDLAKINPRLIYCTISGYDRYSSERERPGYDLVIQGETGLMGMNGDKGQPPLKFGVAVVDLFTGMYCAQAISAALYEREKTGCGQHIEMSLYNSGVHLTAYYGLDALYKQKDPEKYGNNHPSIVPYGVFEAADGPLVITVGNNKQFAAFCEHVIYRSDMANDPRFATNLERTKHRDEIAPIVKDELKKHKRDDLIARMQAVGIPCGNVNGLYEAFTSKRSEENDIVERVEHPIAGHTNVLNPPYRFGGTRSPLRMRPPMLAEHSREILANELGFTEQEIEAFLAEKQQ